MPATPLRVWQAIQDARAAVGESFESSEPLGRRRSGDKLMAAEIMPRFA
jgi:hypothetical protein